MKETKYVKSDKSEGVKYTLEANDIVVSNFDKPIMKERAVIVKGRPTIIRDYTLSVKWNSKDIYVSLTKGQGESLLKKGDLQGKTIKAVNYDNEYGKGFVGLRVQ